MSNRFRKETTDDVPYVSTTIKCFFDFLNTANMAYECAKNALSVEDKRAVDLIHMIEFESDYDERGQICTQLHNSRLIRRNNKDILEELYPIVKWMSDEKHLQALSDLNAAINEMEKIEKRRSNRSYKFKVIDFNEYVERKTNEQREKAQVK